MPGRRFLLSPSNPTTMHINGELHLQLLFVLPSLSIGSAFQCCEDCDDTPKDAPSVVLVSVSFLFWSLHIAFGGEASS